MMVQFAVEHSRSQTPVGRPVVRQLSFPDGTPWTEFYRIPGGILLRFPGLADYEVSADGLKIRCFPEAEVSAATVDHLYANQVLPLALSRLGKIVIHAAAVETGGKGIAFVGESGRGKSTLAASFATSGLRLLADDNLVIESIGADYWIQPGLPVIRLWDDSHKALVWDSAPRDSGLPHTSKARFLAGEQIGYCGQPCLLRYAYLLGGETTGPAEFEPLAPADALVELVRHSFILDIEAKNVLADQFEQISGLVRQPIFFRLNYPRRYGVLADVRAAVLRHCGS